MKEVKPKITMNLSLLLAFRIIISIILFHHELLKYNV